MHHRAHLFRKVDRPAADVISLVVKVLHALYEVLRKYRIYSLYVLDNGEYLAYHHEHADVSSCPLHRADSRALYGGMTCKLLRIIRKM